MVKPEHSIESILRKRFGRIRILASSASNSDERLLIERRHLVDALHFLQLDPDTQFDLLVDISAIHHVMQKETFAYSFAHDDKFLEVFYLLRSTRLRYRLCISVIVPQEMSSLPTISTIYPSANWLERELWDMFGVFVEGHPDLRRILLFEGFASHPLRKTYEEPLQS